MRPVLLAALVAAFFPFTPAKAGPAAGGALGARGTSFELSLPGGRSLDSRQLVGAVLEMTNPAGVVVKARIDAVSPAPERPAVLLHTISVQDPATGAWGPMCLPDAKGRRAAFPVAGRFDARGRYTRDPSDWFLTCTGGAQGKCILWGYDPWGRGPHGENLALYYQACQRMVRADYEGLGTGHTRDGTEIDVWDAAGIQTPDTLKDPGFAFEAGWGPGGAVCVNRTRWRDLLPIAVLLQSRPDLGARPCDAAEARRRGALLFNRSRP